MKDLPPRPQPPQPYVALPRELRLIQVGDGELQDALDGDRRHVVRARSARRRLFVDDEPADENGAAVHMLQPAQQAVDMAAEETAAATRRWNFDFENERPLEGQWEWEKVGELADSSDDETGGRQQAQPVDGSHSPQR